MELLEKIIFWYKNSRPYSIPITLLSWLLIFVFSLKSGGNAFLGLIALVGILLTHLSTNLADDYFDYKRLQFDEFFLNSTKEIKCKYLKEGKASITDLRNVIIGMLSFAALIGAILFFASGFYVAIFALIGLIIALSYSAFSSRGLGDIAVIIAYGPLMYEGVFYVMTGKLSLEVLILSIAAGTMVNTVLYAHMLMDYDEDVISNKTTLCTRLGSKNNALKGLIIFYILGYSMLGIMAVRCSNILYLLPILTLPLVFDLYKSLNIYNNDKTIIPCSHFWHFPLDNWKELSKNPNASFFFRFLFARNIVTYFMLLACCSVIFS
ncbi:prenyltransferase [bacterium]|nr:prenyltransferase [bacterium]